MGITGYFLHAPSPRIYCLQNESLKPSATAEILHLTGNLSHCGQSPGCLFIISAAFELHQKAMVFGRWFHQLFLLLLAT